VAELAFSPQAVMVHHRRATSTRFAWERVPANLGRPVATTDRFGQAAGEIDVLLAGAED
jgi:hypothetical protein